MITNYFHGILLKQVHVNPCKRENCGRNILTVRYARTFEYNGRRKKAKNWQGWVYKKPKKIL